MITYQRLAWKLDPIKTPDDEDREDYLFAAKHCVRDEVRRRAWRIAKITEIASELSASAAWERFRDVARVATVEDRCPADPTSVRLAVQLARWTIHRSRRRALRYAELAWKTCEALELDLWTASNLRPVTLSQYAKCVDITGGDAEFMIHRAQRELGSATGWRERAETLSLVASVLRLKDRSRGIHAAREAAELFTRIGDHHERGRVLLLLADLLEEEGRGPLRDSRILVDEALRGICRLRDLQQWQGATMSKANLQLMAGHFNEARVTLSQVGKLRGSSHKLHRDWIEARIDLCSGSAAKTCEVLTRIAGAFQNQGRSELACSALADLAVAMHFSGHAEAAKRTARAVGRFFSVLKSPPISLNVMEQIEADRKVPLADLQKMWRAS
ncbi:MAG: hypothetical protein AAGD06_07395 [Acidobacteriota bacterium]